MEREYKLSITYVPNINSNEKIYMLENSICFSRWSPIAKLPQKKKTTTNFHQVLGKFFFPKFFLLKTLPEGKYSIKPNKKRNVSNPTLSLTQCIPE